MHLPEYFTSNASFFYSFFYALPFYLVTIGMLWVGYRNKYPMIPYMIILGMGRLGFLLGTWLGGGALLHAGSGRSTLYSLLVAALFVWGSIRWLDFRKPVLDVYALFLPMALAVQRLGCLSVGCCFGEPTDLPWGIEYPIHSVVGHAHQWTGAVSELASHSLAVHPVPIYFMIGYLFAQTLLLFVRKRLANKSGSLALFALILLSGVRFVTEFFRDSMSNHQLGELWFGLKGLQWLNLAFMLFLLALMWINSRRNPQYQGAHRWNIPHSQREWTLMLTLSSLILLTMPMLNRAEWISQLPLLVLLLFAVVRRSQLTHLAKTLVLGVSCAVFAMASVDSTKTQLNVLLGLGMESATFEYPTHAEEGCGGTDYSEYRRAPYKGGIVSAQMSVENLNGIRKYFELKWEGYRGSYQQGNGSYQPSNGSLIEVNGNLGWFGLGIGALYRDNAQNTVIDFSKPVFHAQIGNYRNLYLIAGTPASFNDVYLGLGGTFFDGSMLWEIGAIDNEGFYVKSRFEVMSELLLETSVTRVLPSVSDELTEDNASIKLLYRFD